MTETERERFERRGGSGNADWFTFRPYLDRRTRGVQKPAPATQQPFPFVDRRELSDRATGAAGPYGEDDWS